MGNKQTQNKIPPIQVTNVKANNNNNYTISKTLLIGKEGCGKTSLAQCVAKLPFDEKYTTTIGIDFTMTIYEKEGFKLRMWNTAGNDRYKTIAHSYYRGVKFFILVLDITQPFENSDIDVYLDDIDRHCDQTSYNNVIFVATKDDLCDEDISNHFLLKFKSEYPNDQLIIFSSKTKKGLKQLNEAIIEKMQQSCVYQHQEMAK